MLVAHVILVSAQGPNPSFFLFIQLLFDLGACWDQDLDQGLTISKFIQTKLNVYIILCSFVKKVVKRIEREEMNRQ